ncbi:hypothetical protein DIPPA_04913 [Diplonema papillatum]|nr:hypothetical protein DIPPA_04913 [Diplonema papillatum]
MAVLLAVSLAVAAGDACRVTKLDDVCRCQSHDNFCKIYVNPFAGGETVCESPETPADWKTACENLALEHFCNKTLGQCSLPTARTEWSDANGVCTSDSADMTATTDDSVVVKVAPSAFGTAHIVTCDATRVFEIPAGFFKTEAQPLDCTTTNDKEALTCLSSEITDYSTCESSDADVKVDTDSLLVSPHITVANGGNLTVAVTCVDGVFTADVSFARYTCWKEDSCAGAAPYERVASIDCGSGALWDGGVLKFTARPTGAVTCGADIVYLVEDEKKDTASCHAEEKRPKNTCDVFFHAAPLHPSATQCSWGEKAERKAYIHQDHFAFEPTAEELDLTEIEITCANVIRRIPVTYEGGALSPSPAGNPGISPTVAPTTVAPATNAPSEVTPPTPKDTSLSCEFESGSSNTWKCSVPEETLDHTTCTVDGCDDSCGIVRKQDSFSLNLNLNPTGSGSTSVTAKCGETQYTALVFYATVGCGGTGTTTCKGKAPPECTDSAHLRNGVLSIDVTPGLPVFEPCGGGGVLVMGVNTAGGAATCDNTGDGPKYPCLVKPEPALPDGTECKSSYSGEVATAADGTVALLSVSPLDFAEGWYLELECSGVTYHTLATFDTPPLPGTPAKPSVASPPSTPEQQQGSMTTVLLAGFIAFMVLLAYLSRENLKACCSGPWQKV